MKKKPTYKRNMLSVPRIHYCIKRHYKTKFKEKITTPAINKIWRDYIEEEFIKDKQSVRAKGGSKLTKSEKGDLW